MCGIAGFIDNTVKKEDACILLERMLETIAHRGPDARGKWLEAPVYFGHNRLTIIDLSEAANQPMFYQDLVITYNGEIYNYIEVKEELIKKGYLFTTSSDTEVILAAYKEWGEECVTHFVGMWSFVLYDRSNKKLFCSRDRFGIKPFYYIHSGEKFYFGSEYKPLKLSSLFSNELNLNQAYRYLQLGWITYNDETYFKHISQLPAACNLVFKDGTVRVTKYWDIDLDYQINASPKEKEQMYYDLFMNALKIHMRSDVEIGICLSGGLDSSSLAASIGKQFPEMKIKAYHIYYDGKGDVDERPWVKKVLNMYPNFIPRYYSPNEKEIDEDINKFIHFADVPMVSSSVSQFFLMKMASEEKIKILISGQGADETIGGYLHSHYRLIGGYYKKLQFIKGFKTLLEYKNYQGYGWRKTFDIFLKSVLSGLYSEQKLYSMEFKHYYPFLPQNRSIPFILNKEGGSRLSNFLYQLTFTTSLPTIIHFEDRISMTSSIEERVPFLDHRLIELVFSLNDTDKICKGETKSILRRAMKPLLPDSITSRKDKKGYVAPGDEKWLRGSLKHMLSIDTNKLNFINKDVVDKIINGYLKGDNRNSKMIWRLALFNQWFKQNNI